MQSPSSDENIELLELSKSRKNSFIEGEMISKLDGNNAKTSRKVPVSENTVVGVSSAPRSLTYSDVTPEASTAQGTFASEYTTMYLAEVAESESDKLLVPIESTNDVIKIEKKDSTLSIRTLLKSPPVWAIIAAQYGQSWGAIGLLSWLPTYYSKRFNVPFESLSEFTVLPYFLQMIVGVSAGFIADKLISSGVRTLLVRNILQITGMLFPAVCLALCAYLPSLSSAQAAILITSGSALSALTVAAVSANHFDISPENAGTIYGIGNTAGCIGTVSRILDF